MQLSKDSQGLRQRQASEAPAPLLRGGQKEPTIQPQEGPKVQEPPNILTEQRITPAKFQQIVDLACMLQRADLEKGTNEDKGREVLAKVGSPTGIPRSVVSKVIEDHMEVGRSYAEKALQILCPTKEEMEADIVALNAQPTNAVIRHNFEAKFSRALQETYPFKKVLIYHPEYYSGHIAIAFIEEKIRERRFLFWRLKPEKVREVTELADMDISGFHSTCELSIYSPLFARACTDAIKQLQEKFGRYVAFKPINYSYDPENMPLE
jgi:hypothetical protein